MRLISLSVLLALPLHASSAARGGGGLVLRGFRPHDPVCPPGAGVPLRLPWMEEAMADPRLVLKIAHVRTHRA